MCKATSELKFCTCSIDEDDEPENYWMLYSKKDEGDFTATMGEIVWVQPDKVRQETLKAFILATLNSENCFDAHLNIMEEDILEISVTIGEEYYRYYLHFLSGKWQECSDEIDQFAIMDFYNKYSEGITRPHIYDYFKSKT